jgi:hypothetical protein
MEKIESHLLRHSEMRNAGRFASYSPALR